MKQSQPARHATAVPAFPAEPAEAAASNLQKPGQMPARRAEAVLAIESPGAELREPEPETTHAARPARPRQPAQSSDHGSPKRITAVGRVGRTGARSATDAPKVPPALLDTLELLEPAAEDLLGDSERRASGSPGRASEPGQGSRRSSPASKFASQIPPRSPVRAHLAAQQVCATPHKYCKLGVLQRALICSACDLHPLIKVITIPDATPLVKSFVVKK